MGKLDLSKAKNDSPKEKVDLSKIKKQSIPDVPSVDVSFKDKSGVELAKRVLCIITICIVILCIWLIVIEALNFSRYNALCDAKSTIETLKNFNENVENHRKFILQLFQIILLNLLLPVLTAILGYVFGRSEN